VTLGDEAMHLCSSEMKAIDEKTAFDTIKILQLTKCLFPRCKHPEKQILSITL
jgi:hypothetical protein